MHAWYSPCVLGTTVHRSTSPGKLPVPEPAVRRGQHLRLRPFRRHRGHPWLLQHAGRDVRQTHSHPHDDPAANAGAATESSSFSFFFLSFLTFLTHFSARRHRLHSMGRYLRRARACSSVGVLNTQIGGLRSDAMPDSALQYPTTPASFQFCVGLVTMASGIGSTFFGPFFPPHSAVPPPKTCRAIYFIYLLLYFASMLLGG